MPALTPRGTGRRAITEINMVPFIDVMLVLLIIFMVTAPLIVPGQVELPSVGQAARQPERFIHVMVARDGALRVREGAQGGEGEPVTLRNLAERVRALQGSSTADGASVVPVIISADKRATYEHVMAAMDALQRAGVARVGLAVRQDGSGR